MSELPKKIPMFDMGDHHVLHAFGRCAFCNTLRGVFVNRGGRTRCAHCDAKEEERKALLARLTFEEMQRPVVVLCTCKVSKDPSELFGCTCDASDPANKPVDPNLCNCSSPNHALFCPEWTF